MRIQSSARAAMLCLVAPTIAVVPAGAQLANGYSGFSGAPRDGTLDEFYWTLAEMGRCLAKGRKKEAVALATSRPGSNAEAVAYKMMLGRPSMCVRGASTIAVPTNMIRGAIAEALCESSQRAPLPASDAVVPVVLNRADRATIRMDGVLDQFAKCLAIARPVAVHALLATTKLGSKNEDAEVTRMSRDFGPCLSTDGTVRFRASELRLSLAEAMFDRTPPKMIMTNKAD